MIDVRLLQLVGSPVDEVHAELSRLYAAGCQDALSPSHDVSLAYVSPGGDWRFPTSLRPADIADAPALPLAAAIEHIGARTGRRVPQMFCLPGMTAYRALFDIVGIPYVGNTPTVMGTAADKAMTRAIVAAAGVAVPAGEVIRPGDATESGAPGRRQAGSVGQLSRRHAGAQSARVSVGAGTSFGAW